MMLEGGNPYGAICKPLCLERTAAAEAIAVKKAKGGTVKPLQVSIQTPSAMLYELCKTSAWFSEVVEAALLVNPCSEASPWTIIL